MTDACPLPTPVERRYAEITARVQDALTRKVRSAIEEAHGQARDEITAAGLDLPPPSPDYFTAVIHQTLFCILCKADPQTFAGGRPDIAAAIIGNERNIARHHWGAGIEELPRS